MAWHASRAKGPFREKVRCMCATVFSELHTESIRIRAVPSSLAPCAYRCGTPETGSAFARMVVLICCKTGVIWLSEIQRRDEFHDWQKKRSRGQRLNAGQADTAKSRTDRRDVTMDPTGVGRARASGNGRPCSIGASEDSRCKQRCRHGKARTTQAKPSRGGPGDD